MKILEIFESIQGESSYQGQPCLFIRTVGCNLRCPYCDTKESWTATGTEMSVERLTNLILKSPLRLIEFTGGEPLLWKREIGRILWRLKSSNKTILIETNGTVNVFPLHVFKVKFIADVKDPKIGKFEMKNFKWLNSENSELKFLIGNQNEENFVVDFLTKYSKICKTKTILISPLFINGKLYKRDWSALLLFFQKLFPQFNFRLNLQIHKFLGVK